MADEALSVHRAAPGIPAQRALAGHLLVNADGILNVPPLLVFRHILVVNPLQPMAGNFPARLDHRPRLLRRTLQGGGHAINRERNLAAREHAPQPPEAGPRPIFINRFHVPVALPGPGNRTNGFRQESLRGRITMQNIVLAALFVVQYELHGYTRSVRPFRIRNGPAITLKITRIVDHELFLPPHR